ncbi:MAG TPA: hydroxyphenylacetyl-CoA thioesterase PaaI [Deinococcales bacterium]|nr:hydroxyphenylacetyl-CoA thioesterase PaaI [Deinococcales bacterium]
MTRNDTRPDPYMQLLGIEVLEAGEGRAALRATVRPEHLNLHGTAHGGFTYSLADAAFALASNSREAVAVALSATMQYFRPLREGDTVTAEASEEHLGRSTASYRVLVTVGGKPAALFNGTVFRRER